MNPRPNAALATALMIAALSGCQSKKEAVQFACDAPKQADSALPPAVRGQTVASYIEENVENDEVLGVLTSNAPRTVKAKKLWAMASAEGVEPCALAELWSTPSTIPAPPMSAMPGMRGRPPAASGSSAAPGPGFLVRGKIDTKTVKEVVDGNDEAVANCYKKGLRRSKDLQGRLRVELTITSEGKVQDARAVQVALDDEEVVECIVKSFRGLTFPKPEEGEATIQVPLFLKLGA